MPIMSFLAERLFTWFLGTLILSAGGTLAVLCSREPVRKARLIGLTLAMCLAWPILSELPLRLGLPAIGWGQPTRPESTTPVVAAEPVAAPAAEEPPALPVVPLPEEGLAPPTAELVATDELDNEIIELSTEPGAADEVVDLAEVDLPESAPDNLEPSIEIPAAVAAEQLVAAPVATKNENPSAPAVAPTPLSERFGQWLVWSYVVGVIALSAWWLVGLIGLSRILTKSQRAPDWCAGILRSIGGSATAKVKLLISSQAPQPFTFAAIPPVIVLPEAMCLRPASKSGGEMAAIRWGLAHEWSHVSRGDVWVWALAGLVRVLFWYQPALWWLRRELRLCQDYLADQAAAGETAPENYARFLVSRVMGRPLALGLGITGGRSDLYRRVAMLVGSGRRLENRCPRRFSVMAFAAMLLFSLSVVAAFPPNESASQRKRADVASGKKSEGRDPQEKSAAPKAAAGEVDVNQLVAAVLERSEAPMSARISYLILSQVQNEPSFQREGQLTILKDRWVMSEPAPGYTVIDQVEGERWLRATIPQKDVGQEGGGGLGMMGGRMPEAVPPGMAAGGAKGRRNAAAMMMQRAMPGADAARGMMPAIPMGGVPGGVANRVFAQIEIDYAELARPMIERGTPVRFGMIFYAGGREFVRRHLNDVRAVPPEAGADPAVRIVEWSVSPDEAAAAFPVSNTFLQLGGTLRLSISSQEPYPVTRIESLDKFGTVQHLVEFEESADPNSGEPSRTARFTHGNEFIVMQIQTFEALDPDAEGSADAFRLPIPVGTIVKDNRPRTGDSYDAMTSPQYRRSYPLRAFATTASYPQGFPPALLKELERDVMPWKEATRPINPGEPSSSIYQLIKLGYASARGVDGVPVYAAVSPAEFFAAPASTTARAGTDGASPVSSTANPATPLQAIPGRRSDRGTDSTQRAAVRRAVSNRPRGQLRYDGKSFDEWSRILLEDLSPLSRIQALQALAALGANGYGAETAAAIGEILDAGESSETDERVLNAAFSTLCQLRPPEVGLPLLESALIKRPREPGSVEPSYLRKQAVGAMCSLAARTRAAVPALLKELPGCETNSRGWIFRALLGGHLAEEGVEDAIVTEFLGDKPAAWTAFSNLQFALMQNGTSSPELDQLLTRLLNESNEAQQIPARALFAGWARNTAENRELLKKSLLGADLRARERFVLGLIESSANHSFPKGWEVAMVQMRKREETAALVIPILCDLLQSPESYKEEAVRTFPARMLLVLGSLGREDQAARTVPVLHKALRDELPAGGIRGQWAAVQALFSIGHAARELIGDLQTLHSKKLSQGEENALNTVMAEVNSGDVPAYVPSAAWLTLVEGAMIAIDPSR